MSRPLAVIKLLPRMVTERGSLSEGLARLARDVAQTARSAVINHLQEATLLRKNSLDDCRSWLSCFDQHFCWISFGLNANIIFLDAQR